MRGVAEKYDLYRNIRLSTSVLSADWNEDDQRWTVVTRSADGTVERHRARAVVTALGMLNAPNIPDVEGWPPSRARSCTPPNGIRNWT